MKSLKSRSFTLTDNELAMLKTAADRADWFKPADYLICYTLMEYGLLQIKRTPHEMASFCISTAGSEYLKNVVSPMSGPQDQSGQVALVERQDLSPRQQHILNALKHLYASLPAILEAQEDPRSNAVTLYFADPITDEIHDIAHALTVIESGEYWVHVEVPVEGAPAKKLVETNEQRESQDVPAPLPQFETVKDGRISAKRYADMLNEGWTVAHQWNSGASLHVMWVRQVR